LQRKEGQSARIYAYRSPSRIVSREGEVYNRQQSNHEPTAGPWYGVGEIAGRWTAACWLQTSATNLDTDHCSL